MDNKLLETIKIENGLINNIEYHQKRFDDSRHKLFGIKEKINLEDVIVPPSNGLSRCRIIYDKDIKTIEYLPYVPKTLSNFKIISSNIDYSFKYANRSELDNLKAKYLDFDEVIIEKNGVLTDTTISNIAFFDGLHWITPASPLLNGTMRAKLIDEGFLKTKDIKSSEILKYTRFAIINALVGFYEIDKYIIKGI